MNNYKNWGVLFGLSLLGALTPILDPISAFLILGKTLPVTLPTRVVCTLLGMACGMLSILYWHDISVFKVTETVKTIDSETSSSKREQQHQIILAVINALNYEPLEIPTGGKSKIKEICLKSVRVFTDSSFDHAWKKGTGMGLFRLLDSDRFTSK